MNKLPLFLICLVLTACTGGKTVRPNETKQGEQLLLAGIEAYKQDDYSRSLRYFQRGLQLFQSLDQTDKVQIARINTIEAALAISDFATAEEQLSFLHRQANNGLLSPSLQRRQILLSIKSHYLQARYRQALTELQPILDSTDDSNDTRQQLEILATAARLEVLTSPPEKRPWLDQFRALLSTIDDEAILTEYRIILQRIDVILAAQQHHYAKAIQLLQEALAYYKENHQRRAMAACLEEIAEYKIALQHPALATDYLQRALAIRQWLQDKTRSNAIIRKIAQIQP